MGYVFVECVVLQKAVKRADSMSGVTTIAVEYRYSHTSTSICTHSYILNPTDNCLLS